MARLENRQLALERFMSFSNKIERSKGFEHLTNLKRAYKLNFIYFHTFGRQKQQTNKKLKELFVQFAICQFKLIDFLVKIAEHFTANITYSIRNTQSYLIILVNNSIVYL